MPNVVSMKSRTEDRYPSLFTRLKRAATQRFRFLGSFWFLNGFTQACFLSGLTSIAGWGVGVAIPMLYSEHQYTGPLVRAFGCFLAFQLIVNWFFIKTVDSSYKPSTHGTKPDYVEMGENINAARHKNNGTEIKKQQRKDATSLKMNQGSLMYVATEYPKTDDSPPTRTAYPYFSWTPCLRCNRPRPPRCHHCPSCNKCILKRDHHCFLSGVCVGYHNLRHFAVFITWAAVATVFSALHALPYFYYEVLPFISVFDILFPIAIVRYLFGYIELKCAFLVVTIWLVLAFLVWSVAFFGNVYNNLRTGLTSFEIDMKFIVYDTRSLEGKLEAVFGKFWWLNFIVPLHFVFKPIDDPISWPTIRA